MNRLFGRLLALVGAVLAIVAFFVPWVSAHTLEGLVPLLSTLGSLLNDRVGDLIGGASQFTTLTGSQLTSDLPWATTWFKVPVILPVALGGLVLLWLLVAFATHPRNGRVIDLALAVVCVVAGILLIVNANSITHLAIADRRIGVALSALGLRLSAGYWLAVAALLLMALGLALGTSDVPVAAEDDLSSY